MDIMLRTGHELNIKWTISISLIFHIVILFLLLTYNLFTKTGSFENMYKPFTAVQVNLVNSPANENIAVSSDEQAAGSRKQETRSKVEEVSTRKQDVISKKSDRGKPHEDAVIKSGTIPPLDNKKLVNESAVQTGLTSEVAPVTHVAKLTTPWQGDNTAASTIGQAGPVVDASDFKYDYYLGLIRNKVDNRWKQPVTYSHVKKAVVEFMILRNGRIDNIRLSETSGDTYFDQTALRAVSLSAPFPPLPKGYKENSLRVRYKFIFEKG